MERKQATFTAANVSCIVTGNGEAAGSERRHVTEIQVGARPDARPELFAAPSPIPSRLADPSVLVDRGRFHLYPTTDGSADWGATSFSVFTSTDLEAWEDGGVVLDVAADVPWADGHAWAPVALERSGRYYLYFTADSNIGVAVADSPMGPFVDSGRPLIADGDHPGRAIDPAVFVDDDGTHYLLWGNGVANIARLDGDLIHIDESSVVSFVPTQFREAAWLHKRGAVYYLSWSVDDTRSEDYHVQYATASAPTGPWTDRGVLLEKAPGLGVLGPGHHAVFAVPGTEEWVIAYHRFAIPDGNGFDREIVFAPLEHTADGLLLPVEHLTVPMRRPLSA